MRYSYGLILFLVISAVSALVMPPGLADPLRKFGVLLEPVSFPVRHIAQRIDSQFGRVRATPSEEKAGQRALQEVMDERKLLEDQVYRLTVENEQLQKQLQLVDAVNKRHPGHPVRVLPVVAAALGTQQVLMVQGSDDGLAPEMVAEYTGGMVGKLEIVGLGTVHVRLITDKRSAIEVKFRHYLKDTSDYPYLPQEAKIARGTGDGRLVIEMKKEEAFPPGKVGALAVGELVAAEDRSLPVFVRGLKLGEIESITPGKLPLFVNIIVRPDTDLMKLSEVMVPVQK